MMSALSCSVAPCRCEDGGAAEVAVVNVSSEDCTRLFLRWVQLSDGDFGDVLHRVCYRCFLKKHHSNSENGISVSLNGVSIFLSQ